MLTIHEISVDVFQHTVDRWITQRLPNWICRRTPTIRNVEQRFTCFVQIIISSQHLTSEFLQSFNTVCSTTGGEINGVKFG